MEGCLKGLIKLCRYRFMLIAGLFPYLLGSSLSYFILQEFNLQLFLIALVGILFALLGVESFNEFFDWQLGTDRIFQLDPKPITAKTLLLGLGAFFIAFLIAIYLTEVLSFLIMLFALFGFFAALFYLCPPLKLTYRGLGEVVIALAYGPFMVAGSYFVQTKTIDIIPIIISIVPALFLYAIAVLNEIPDYIQDSLVGKRNICVRLKQKNALILASTIILLVYIFLAFIILRGLISQLNWLSMICLPFALYSFYKGFKNCISPKLFLPTIRSFLFQYVIVLTLMIISCF